MMNSRISVRLMACTCVLISSWAHAEFPPLPEETVAERPKYPAATNRWQGNYPELEQALSDNPWGGSGPIIREQPRNQFAAPQQQFADPNYSPYEEGRKKMHSRQPPVGMPPVRGYPGAGPGYPPPYYPPAGVTPYGGGYPGGYPGAYGGPWPGAGPSYGGPWNRRGGSFPFSPFNW